MFTVSRACFQSIINLYLNIYVTIYYYFLTDQTSFFSPPPSFLLLLPFPPTPQLLTQMEGKPHYHHLQLNSLPLPNIKCSISKPISLCRSGVRRPPIDFVRSHLTVSVTVKVWSYFDRLKHLKTYLLRLIEIGQIYSKSNNSNRLFILGFKRLPAFIDRPTCQSPNF